MLFMILKMSAVTIINVLLTMFLWFRTRNRPFTPARRIVIGVIYGICAILSTHFGVDYHHMMLNVRDMSPLAAGLFFDPASGIIAGLIGGIERYIAGTWWGVGSYTRIACSVSTCLAGFVAAGLNILVFKRKKPSATYAFFMGAVMEVFHMYVVFITHRDDMNMAFYVVRTVSVPMILFTALGLAASSSVLQMLVGQWKNPLRKISQQEIPVSRTFQTWLFAVTLLILAGNFTFSFLIQTQSAIQDARSTLEAVSGDIRQTYDRLRETQDNTDSLAEKTAQSDAVGIAEAVERAGGVQTLDDAFLERLRSVYDVKALAALDGNGQVLASAGEAPVYSGLLARVLDGEAKVQVVKPSPSLVAAGARCGEGVIQVVIATSSLSASLDLSSLNEALSYFHVGNEGTFDIFSATGIITFGNHRSAILTPAERELIKSKPEKTCFTADLFGEESLCYQEQLSNGVTLLTCLKMSEVYGNRNIQAFEEAFADILLFAVIYVLISLLVQGIVVHNLELVNGSLNRITDGHLDEVVDVSSSLEFASLSTDINQMVSALKGYIAAAEKRIEEELELARTIQDSALPRNFTFPRNDFDLYALMDPAKEVGGDFYDFFFVGQSKLALVIADVSGKGIPAALFMMRAKTAIRGLAESGGSPSDILYRTNNTLCEGNDAEMFVTVWLGIIDLTTGLMRCANAGHEYPVIRRAGCEWELLKDRHGLALAAYEGMRYKEYELQFAPGDSLFVYTDGVPEAIDEGNEQYGNGRMVEALNRLGRTAMQETLPALRQDIRDFVGKADQFDDITMLGFDYVGAQQSADGEAQ